jgi:hypothetical protein
VLVKHDTDLWSIEYELAWQGGLVPIPVRMTVIRLPDGDLILHSPVPLSEPLRADLDALGRVGFLVIPWAHGAFAQQAGQVYPEAQLLAAPEASRRRKALGFHATLADHAPESWSGVVETHLVRGFRLNEVVLFHRPSRTLVVTDLCFNIHDSRSVIARLFFRANGMWQRFGPSRLIRNLAVSDRIALDHSLEQIMRWEFERILPGHGEVVEQGGRVALRSAWFP